MKKVKVIEAIICIDIYGNGILLKIPKELVKHLDGSFCADNFFSGVPEERGVYSCEIEYSFSQGYSEGNPDDGESSWKFKIIRAKQLLDLNDS